MFVRVRVRARMCVRAMSVLRYFPGPNHYRDFCFSILFLMYNFVLFLTFDLVSSGT